MSFTDDDLKRLKADIAYTDETREQMVINWTRLEMIKALLARLEAAEEAIHEMEYCTSAGWNTTTRGLIWDAIKAWRKAAGK